MPFIQKNDSWSYVLNENTNDDGGRGHVLSTSTDDCCLLITLSVQLCIGL